MPPLTIQQIRGPNLSGISEALANSGRAFDRGLTSAQDVLSQYQQGKQAKADRSIIEDLAGIQDEAGLDAYLASDATRGLDLSPEMQATLLGLRDRTIDFTQGRADIEGTRANTEGTRARTAATRAAAGRAASAAQFDINARNERLGLNSLATQASIEARTLGENRDGAPTPHQDAYNAALLETQYLTPGQTRDLRSNVYTDQGTGQGNINASRGRELTELAAIAADEAGSSAAVLSQGDASKVIDNQLRANSNLTAVERDLVGDSARALIAEDDLTSGATGLAPEVRAHVSSAVVNISESLDRDSNVRAHRISQEYTGNSGDIAAKLVTDLVDRGGSELDPTTVRAELNRLASDPDLNLTIPQAAAAFRLAAEQDDNFFVGADGIITIGGDGLSQWEAFRQAAQFFKGNQSATTRRFVTDYNLAVGEVQSIQSNADEARQMAQKYLEENSRPSPRLEQRANDLRQKLLDAVSKLNSLGSGPQPVNQSAIAQPAANVIQGAVQPVPGSQVQPLPGGSGVAGVPGQNLTPAQWQQLLLQNQNR